MKMPNWTREELILALQLYCKYDLRWLNRASEDSAEIIELSNVLRKLPIHSNIYREISNFRSPSSVHMKLMNFLRYDDQHGKKGLRIGLQNGSKLEQEIWDEFSKNESKINEAATMVLKNFPVEIDNKLISKVDLSDTELNIKEILIPMMNEISNKMEYIKIDCARRRKQAAFMESLDESQNIINEMYKSIMQLNDWTARINIIKKEIHESNLLQYKQHDKYEVEKGKDVKIGQLVKTNLTELFLTEKLSGYDIENLLDEIWSRETFHIGYPFLKVYDQSLSTSEQQKVEGYYRYWGQVFSYKGGNYLACKEWHESNRKYFLSWISNFEAQTINKIENQDNLQTKPIYTFTIPIQVEILGIKHQVKNWANVLVKVCEVMIELKPHIVEKFDKNPLFEGKSRVYFSYNKDELTRSSKKLSNMLWVETNFSSQDITMLCKEIIKECGYKEEDINFIVISKEQKTQYAGVEKNTAKLIKLSNKYSSIEINKELLIFILQSIKEIDEDEVCIETKVILKKVEDKLHKESAYKNHQHLLNNIIKYLIDKGILVLFQDSKRGKYVIEDYETMHNLIAEPEIITEL